MFMLRVWILWSKKKKIVIIFQKENGNTFTLLIIFIVKSLQKEQNSTNLLLWPPICRNKPAITPKWFNSLDTNSIKYLNNSWRFIKNLEFVVRSCEQLKISKEFAIVVCHPKISSAQIACIGNRWFFFDFYWYHGICSFYFYW